MMDLKNCFNLPSAMYLSLVVTAVGAGRDVNVPIASPPGTLQIIAFAAKAASF